MALNATHTKNEKTKPGNRRGFRLMSRCRMLLALLRRVLPRVTWRFKIAIRIARIIIRVSVGVAVVEEEFHRFNWNRKAESFAESDFHVRDADDFTGHVEERAAAVAGIDLRGRLQIKLALKLARLGAENPFRHRALKT